MKKSISPQKIAYIAFGWDTKVGGNGVKNQKKIEVRTLSNENFSAGQTVNINHPGYRGSFTVAHAQDTKGGQWLVINTPYRHFEGELVIHENVIDERTGGTISTADFKLPEVKLAKKQESGKSQKTEQKKKK